MVSEYDAVEQLSCITNMLKYIIKLGGDFLIHESPITIGQEEKFLSKIFDRTKHSVQKLRHYRFAILGWIARLLESDEFKAKVICSSSTNFSFFHIKNSSSYLCETLKAFTNR